MSNTWVCIAVALGIAIAALPFCTLLRWILRDRK